jgi:hypothetical protein
VTAGKPCCILFYHRCLCGPFSFRVVAFNIQPENVVALPDIAAHLGILFNLIEGIIDLVEADGIGQQGIGLGFAVKWKRLTQFVKSCLQVFTNAFQLF